MYIKLTEGRAFPRAGSLDSNKKLQYIKLKLKEWNEEVYQLISDQKQAA